MNDQSEHESIVDPRHVFLTPVEVMARYRWGRTKGYEVMRGRPNGFPRAIGGRYRLDSLLGWEDHQLGLAAEGQSVSASVVLPLLPPRKRHGRKAAS
jgi:hypothetical protein